MRLESKLPQTATYWAASKTTDLYGKPTYTAPKTVKCRWENVNELFQSKSGEERTSKSKVFSITAMDVDGWLYLGVSSEADPRKVENAWEIQGVSTFPNLRDLQELTVAFL